VTVEQTTDEWLAACTGLAAGDQDKLARIAKNLPFVADVSRSDLILYVRCGDTEAMVVAHARPHSIMPVYAEPLVGRQVNAKDEEAVFSALRLGLRARGSRRLIVGGAPVVQQVWAVLGDEGRVIAALDVEANMVADVRQKSRSRIFQRAVIALQRMLLNGELRGTDRLSPFREHDGILVVDNQQVIQYASGIATELYRRLGYQDSLVGRHLGSLETGDQAMYGRVTETMACQEQEFEEQQYLRGDRPLIWIRKAIPLMTSPVRKRRWKPWQWLPRRQVSVLFTIHDATEERQSERERKIQAAMVQEIHHRVKNNLQTVAALLRMQARRCKDEQARSALTDSVGRILSIAVVHEYLSRAERQAINIRDVTQRIVQEMQQGVLGPDKQISVTLNRGNNIYLPARQATACALAINELFQNAVEHAFEDRTEGEIHAHLDDRGDEVEIVVADNGDGLPDGFELGQTRSLGLQIIRTLVQEDLQGEFTIQEEETGGVRATICFPKQWEGE
jgi:two-component sensor histidine kinase